LATLTEWAGWAAAATILGWFIGIAPASLLVHTLDAAIGGVLAHSILAPRGLAFALLLTPLVGTSMLAAALWPARRYQEGVGAMDAAGLAAVALAVVVALGANGANANDRFLTGVFPIAVAVAAAVGIGRVVPVMLVLVERIVRRRCSLSTRLAMLAMTRQSAGATVLKPAPHLSRVRECEAPEPFARRIVDRV